MLRLASSGLEKSLGEAVKDPQCRTAELCAVASGEFFRAALPSQRVELKDDFGMMAERRREPFKQLLNHAKPC